eukprot:3780755-Rhodomonas_salina.1
MDLSPYLPGPHNSGLELDRGSGDQQDRKWRGGRGLFAGACGACDGGSPDADVAGQSNGRGQDLGGRGGVLSVRGLRRVSWARTRGAGGRAWLPAAAGALTPPARPPSAAAACEPRRRCLSWCAQPHTDSSASTPHPAPSTADKGFYCPNGSAPLTDLLAAQPPSRSSYEGDPLAGRPCPPSRFCAGLTAQPILVPPVCDLRAGAAWPLPPRLTRRRPARRGRAFFKHDEPPTAHAVDSDVRTRMRTAHAKQDPNPQCVRLDLGAPRLVGSELFVSVGAAAELTVAVAAEHAPAPSPVNLCRQPCSPRQSSQALVSLVGWLAARPPSSSHSTHTRAPCRAPVASRPHPLASHPPSAATH